MPTRLNLEIISHTRLFAKLFKCAEFTDNYLNFKHVGRYWYATATICKTSTKCFRVITYKSYCTNRKHGEYKSFRSITELCAYLETLAEKLC